MGCHGNNKLSYDPNGGFLEDSFFSHLVARVNNLAPMRNCPGECKLLAYWHFSVVFRRVNIFPRIKNGWGNSERQITRK